MRPVRVVAVVGAVVALLGGCSQTTSGTASPAGAADTGKDVPTRDNGVAALPPAQILAKARTALTNASSVHIVGSGRTDGQELSLDLKIKGKDGAAGTLTLPAGRDGSTEKLQIQLIIIGETAYLKANRLLWVGVLGDATAADKLTGKWLQTSVKTAKVKPLLDIANPAEISAELIKPENSLTKGKPKQIREIATVGVVDQGSTGSTIYVATKGEPVPVQIVETGADASVIDFSEYGAPVQLTAPPAAETIDGGPLGL